MMPLIWLVLGVLLGGSAAAGEAPSGLYPDHMLDEYPPPTPRHILHSLAPIIADAESGNIDAQRYLAVSFELGRNGDWDHFEAMRWYRRAAESGQAFDVRQLACFVFRNAGSERRRRAAADGMKKAADAGDAWGALYYSKYLRIGYGVARDSTDADNYLTHAVKIFIAATNDGEHTATEMGVALRDALNDERCAPKDEEAAARVEKLLPIWETEGPNLIVPLAPEKQNSSPGLQ